jgi:predicted RNA-binding Zn-ribbon protein involved in translation (DUF1610 family)
MARFVCKCGKGMISTDRPNYEFKCPVCGLISILNMSNPCALAPRGCKKSAMLGGIYCEKHARMAKEGKI